MNNNVLNVYTRYPSKGNREEIRIILTATINISGQISKIYAIDKGVSDKLILVWDEDKYIKVCFVVD